MTTSLDELPTTDGQNVSLNVNEQPVQQTLQQNEFDNTPSQLSQDDINKIISGIQIASQNNLTQIPSKNIPMDQNGINSDIEARVNFVPEHKEDYIKNSITPEQVYMKQIEKRKEKKQQEDIYEQLQMPVLSCILFFIFQLPFMDKFLYRNFSIFFIKDGSLSLSGYIFKSVLFSSGIYLLQRTLDYLSNM